MQGSSRDQEACLKDIQRCPADAETAQRRADVAVVVPF